MGKAVGIIEVYGLATAFVACDAGCKAADVTVEHFDKNKPANAEKLAVPLIVAIKFRGTVDSVKAAMEAMGYCGPTIRLPLTPMEEDHRATLVARMTELGIAVK